MIKNVFLWLAAVLLCTAAFAQQDTAAKQWKFYSVNSFGTMAGDNGSALTVQSINGLRYKTFSAGIGIGIDNYLTRTIPLFLDIRKDLLNRPQTPFVYIDGGTHFPWTGTQKTWATIETHPGFYYDLGIGYRFPLEQNSLMLSIGYSMKSYTEDVTTPTFCSSCPPHEEHFQYNFRRISLKAGVRF